MSTTIFFWRGTKIDGLERLQLTVEPDLITAASTVICTESGGFRIDHRWRISPDWCVQSAEVERWNAQGHGLLKLERVGSGWHVNGLFRTDLDGAEDPDLSVTPFCNTFPIRRVPDAVGESLTVDTAFVDGPTLTVTRSRQRYDRVGPKQLRYVDLGLYPGFEAYLTVDDNGLVEDYEGLFKRVPPLD